MINENLARIMSDLPRGVVLVAAAKTRTPEEIFQAIGAGVKIIGENYVQEAENAYSVETKRLFDELQSQQSANIEMKYLSMGMSNSYRVAIEEGANVVRIGSKLFVHRRP